MEVKPSELYEKLKERVSYPDGLGNYKLLIDGSEAKALDEIINKGLIKLLNPNSTTVEDYIEYRLS